MVSAEPLQDRYRLHDRIATGGMGTVYSGTDERLGRRVAVKVLKDEFATDPRFVERFRREARAVATLSHPNIAGIFDYGQDDCHFIVMEFVMGLDLARLLHAEGALAPERATHIGAQICAGLAHAHAAGIVHRDIKPANVIVDASDHVKVTDFGIARAVGESTLTATGSTLGTAQYLSPEQAEGRRAGPQSDIYSTGVVLFEMLTGTAPFTGESALAVVMRHVSDDVPRPSSVNSDVPPGFDAIVARATAKAPQERFSTAQEMADALGELAAPTSRAPTPGAARPIATTSPLTREVQLPAGHRSMMGKAILFAFAALAAAVVLLLIYQAAVEDGQNQPAQQPQETAEETPASYTIEESLIGMRKPDAKQYLEGLGLALLVKEEKVASDEFDKDLVIGVSPEVGTVIQEGATITLLVSEGSDDENGEGD